MTASIRFAREDDADQVAAIYDPYCHTPISFEESPPTAGEVRGRIAKTLRQYPWLVCEADGRILGYAYAGGHRERPAYRWSVEASAYVRQGEHRRGVGRALYVALFRLLVLQGYCNAYAGITLPNPASVGLHEAVGFRPVGVYCGVGFKCGAWYDVGWWSLDLRPRPDAPELPHDWRAVPAADVAAALAAGAALLRI
jgi:L-amino acid N-acyltransferase YncA